MPAKLEKCVKSVKKQKGKKKDAYAICSKSTGFKVGKGSTKRKKKWVKESRNFDTFISQVMNLLKERSSDSITFSVEDLNGDEVPLEVQYEYIPSRYAGDRHGRYGNPTPPDPDEVKILSIHTPTGIELKSIDDIGKLVGDLNQGHKIHSAILDQLYSMVDNAY